MRSAGVLMPIASLPSNYGIGTMGKEAHEFIDFLNEAGQSYWQILPICQTGYGDSPYQSVSSFAGNPYWIDLDVLKDQGYLKLGEYKDINWGEDETSIDYEILYMKRYGVLHIATDRMLKGNTDAFDSFCEEEKDWLEDYALYMALKDSYKGQTWQTWPEEIKRREEEPLQEAREKLQDEIRFYKGIQYFFFTQWNELREYAHEKGIQLIGDTPIYVASDSADVWSHPDQFYLDEDLQPIEVAGCPPDGFSADGQLWGNPLYDWNEMEKDEYAWWVNRMRKQTEIYDVIRLDHFRGFDEFYCIPYGDTTARNGHWTKGPGIDLFRALERKLGDLNIIAEDLGFLTQSVIQMVQDSGYPGMKVLELGFDARDSDGAYLPHTYSPHCVVYTGTHDNDTILGWLNTVGKEDALLAKEYCRLNEEEGYNWGMMKTAWSSVADLAIMQAQDLLGIGTEGRINVPSTLGENWKWRSKKDVFTSALAKKIHHLMELYGRI